MACDLLHFQPGTRLMCPNCGKISNNHFCENPFFAKHYTNLLVCYHTCKSCGSTDAPWDGKFLDDVGKFSIQFIDSGNYCSTKYDPCELKKMERYIAELEDGLQIYKQILKDGNEEFERLWLTEEDR